jgi:predicted ferric reductase
MYLGILTLLAFLFTALIAVMNMKGIQTIPFRWHPRFAAVAIVLALIHGTLGILAYF